MIKIAKDMGIEVHAVENAMSEYRRVLRDSTADDQNKSEAAMKLITDLDTEIQELEKVYLQRLTVSNS